MTTPVLSLIRTHYHLFSSSQQQVADYVLAHPEKVMLLSIGDLADSCKVSEPTVMRFLHKMSYRSYQVFRVHIAQEAATNTGQVLYSDVERDDGSAEIARKVVLSTKQSLDNLIQVINTDTLEKLCRAIIKAGMVFIIGVGATYAVAFDFYHKLIKLGFKATCSHDPHIINITCSEMEKGRSLLIALSHSGESREILDGVSLAKRAGCRVFGITSFASSSLAKEADELLLSTSLETNYRSDALTSRILQLCIIDMVYIRLALIGGEKSIEKINASRIAVAQNKT
jgi:DNA-binding MurR/RpiR family transcriptional regulator